jgi:hypothetical protein
MSLISLKIIPSRSIIIEDFCRYHRLDALDTALDALDLDLLLRRVLRSDELSVPIHLLA